MFELSVALRYLLPRRRQLSVSIIALLSVLVISLVVWLILVFFSVTHGMERRWLDSFVTFHAPIQLTPTERYLHSYYHQVDQYSAESDYRLLSIGDKLRRTAADPFDPDVDGELPPSFPLPDQRSNGTLLDPVRDAVAAIEKLEGYSGLAVRDFEISLSGLNLALLRPTRSGSRLEEQTRLNQLSYLGSFDGSNRRLFSKIEPPSGAGLSNLLALLPYGGEKERISPLLFRERLQRFFSHAEVRSLRTESEGYPLDLEILPKDASFRGVGLLLGQKLHAVMLPLREEELSGVALEVEEHGWNCCLGSLNWAEGAWHFFADDERQLFGEVEARMAPHTELPAILDRESVAFAEALSDLHFTISYTLQGVTLQQEIAYHQVELGDVQARVLLDTLPDHPPLWLYSVQGGMELPNDPVWGDGILISSSFHKNGAALGDLGDLAYYASTATSMQEQRAPIFVAGFYNTGFLPVGAKLVLVDRGLIGLVRSSMSRIDPQQGNGLQVWVDDVSQVDQLKDSVLHALREAGVEGYWKVESFKEYEFSKALVEQFQSDRILFSIISTIIIAVACSNIISMLILLVNDKRREVGIMLAMGATRRSIACIFGFCGLFLGMVSTLLGIGAAALTLHNLDLVVKGLSVLQGHQAFNPLFFGESLPSELSGRALGFALLATAGISLIAGLIPAIKASLIQPSTILRSE